MPNTAFIDGQNLYSGIKSLGWTLDTGKFRVRLEQKYGVTRAVYFVGYTPTNEKLFHALKRQGYELAFKPVVAGAGHLPKGNVDADLVLRAMIEYATYDAAVIVSGDGDFYSLAEYLKSTASYERFSLPIARFAQSSCERRLGTSLNTSKMRGRMSNVN